MQVIEKVLRLQKDGMKSEIDKRSKAGTETGGNGSFKKHDDIVRSLKETSRRNIPSSAVKQCKA